MKEIQPYANKPENGEQKRPAMIFDMDGTLYSLDGENNGFKGSTLEQTVFDNAVLFIKDRLTNEDEEQAVFIRNIAVQDTVGISAYLEREYQIPRTQYFDTVWDIDPEGIVGNFETTKQSIQYIKQQKAEYVVILLTSAPRIWARNVLRYMECEELFEVIYTGDQFKGKEDIFSEIGNIYEKERTISFGDQMGTDIVPAQNVGFSGVLITSPQEIWDFISKEEI